MKSKSIADWVFETLVLALAVASFLLMIDGFFLQEWWAGLGLVIFMPSLLCWASIFRGERQAPAAQTIPSLPRNAEAV